MPRRFQKLITRKKDADLATQSPPLPEYRVPIPPPPPDHTKSIPPEITDKTGDMDTLEGKLVRAEMAARRAEAIHSASGVSAEYARTLTNIANDAVACAQARALALIHPYYKAPPPPYEESITTVHGAPIQAKDLYTVDVVLARARRASRIARELKTEAREADEFARKLAWTAHRGANEAQITVFYLFQ
ncbi:hypothetical protein VMCG_05126 [Cytospora schulzeri]|uniref:Uncharacterized protein n=1 Tax=Cytospora schulzeri TaxID=448051 RepID=A0A423WQX8_9PEZI|nr:hypothetical protein VMCG_05126 [Valsa malicola]